MNALVAMSAAIELAAWEAVPGRVRELYKQADAVAKAIRSAIKGLDAMPGYGNVFWHPDKKMAWVVLGDSDEQPIYEQWFNKLKAIPGIDEVKGEAETGPPDRENWVFIKRSASLGFLGQPWTAANKMLGGPSPLSASIVGGLVTGGLGYGAGYLMENLFPDRHLERGRLRKTLGLAGLGVGASYGLWKGTANARNAAAAGQPLGAVGAMTTPDEQVPLKEVTAGLRELAVSLAEIKLRPEFYKAAYGGVAEMSAAQSGGMLTDTIPVDAFNRAVWNDVRKGVTAARNPFGTRDPFGTNDQPMHTPPQLGAATTGLMSGISAMHGDAQMLSPYDLVRGMASAGVGLATANIAGRALGALAGLSPQAQETLQNTGAFAGMLSTIVPAIFGH